MRVRKEEIRAPSIDEQSDELKTASPEKEVAMPVIPPPPPQEQAPSPKLPDTVTNTAPPSDSLPDTPKPTDSVTPAAITKPDSEKPEAASKSPAVSITDTKENKPITKPTDQKNYDATLSAPEVAQKYFVPRPKNRIATKNISFNKSKSKKPKYGRGSSPRMGTGLSPQNPEGVAETAPTDGDRRQLPSRKSRPQQPLDERAETSLLYDEDQLGDDGMMIPSSCIRLTSITGVFNVRKIYL